MADRRNKADRRDTDAPEGSTEGTSQATTQVTENKVLTYRRDHPGDRCSYGVAGVPGIVVFDKGLFADGVAPPTITLDCLLALPKPDKKEEREAARIAKLAEKEEKAKIKAAAAQAKAEERQKKAAEALAKAQEKLKSAAAPETATA
jgi:hypothetical protein